jgi:hypothetical protein
MVSWKSLQSDIQFKKFINNFDRKLEVLSKSARPLGARKEIPVLMHLISAMFDSQRVIDDYMDLQQWRTCYRSLFRVTALLNDSKTLVLGKKMIFFFV